MKALKSLWERCQQVTAKVDNPVGRTVVTALFIVLLFLFPRWWKLFLPLYMLTLGKFVFGVVSRVVLTMIYAVMLTPVGVFVRMSDPLHVRRKAGETYWISRESPDESLEGAGKQG